MTFLNITVGEKEFDEIKEGKVGLVRLPCIPRWCHTLVDGVKMEERLDRLTIRIDSNGKPNIQYGYSLVHYFKKVDYVQLSCKVGSQIRFLVKDCAGFSIETTQNEKANGFIEFKPKNFIVHLK